MPYTVSENPISSICPINSGSPINSASTKASSFSGFVDIIRKVRTLLYAEGVSRAVVVDDTALYQHILSI